MQIQNEELENIDYQSYHNLLELDHNKNDDNIDKYDIPEIEYINKEKELLESIFNRLSYILGKYDNINSIEITVRETDNDYKIFQLFSNILNRLLLESREDLLTHFQNRTSIIMTRRKPQNEKTILVTVDYQNLLKIYKSFIDSPVKKHIP